MKRLTIILACLLAVAPAFAQKMTKEEKAAAAKMAYEAALESLQNKTFVLVPSEYTSSDGEIFTNDDNSVFLSSEGEHMFGQGAIVTDNSNNNIGEATEYDVAVDKKGNVKATITVAGRMWRGTYVIRMSKKGNHADVVFNPQTGKTRRFSGPIVPVVGAQYNKRSNPI